MPIQAKHTKAVTTSTGKNRRKIWICVGLAVAILAVYGQVYHFDFNAFDDARYVLDNWHVTTGLNLRNVIWAFTSGYAANWHPLTWLSHMLDCQLFGLNAGAQHLVNLFFHIANSLILFLLLERLTGCFWRSAFVAALFALHPLHVESVAWIAERKDVLSTLFWLLTIWTYAEYVRKAKTGTYLLALSLFLLGLMAKPMLVTLPFVLLLLDFWPLDRVSFGPTAGFSDGKRSTGAAGKQVKKPLGFLIREKIPFFLMAACSGAVTYLVQKSGGAVKAADVFPFDTRLSNAIHSYAAYLVKDAWPSNLSIFYQHPPDGYPGWQITVAALFLICITVLAVRWAGRFPFFTFGWLLYLGTLVPVAGFVQVGWQAMADRYTYIPLLGIFIIIAWGVPAITGRMLKDGRIMAAVGALVVIVCAVDTWREVHWWKNTETLFSRALKIDKDNFEAHYMLGTVLGIRGDYQGAILHLTAASRIRPSDPDVLSNLGYALYRQGDRGSAIEKYSKALKLVPEHGVALRDMGLALYDRGEYQNALDFFQRARKQLPEDQALLCFLGNDFVKLGRMQEAMAAYNQVLFMKPGYPDALFGLGVALAAQGRTTEALHALESTLRAKPDYAEARVNLGNVFLQQGRFDEAVSQYQEAIRLDANNAEARYDLGVALYGQHRNAEAVAQFREAIKLKPDYADAYYNLGLVQDNSGALQEAAADYLEAIRIKPDFIDAYTNLGIALFHLGQVQKALDILERALRLSPDNAAARANRDAILASLQKSKRNS